MSEKYHKKWTRHNKAEKRKEKRKERAVKKSAKKLLLNNVKNKTIDELLYEVVIKRKKENLTKKKIFSFLNNLEPDLISYQGDLIDHYRIEFIELFQESEVASIPHDFLDSQLDFHKDKSKVKYRNLNYMIQEEYLWFPFFDIRLEGSEKRDEWHCIIRAPIKHQEKKFYVNWVDAWLDSYSVPDWQKNTIHPPRDTCEFFRCLKKEPITTALKKIKLKSLEVKKGLYVMSLLT